MQAHAKARGKSGLIVAFASVLLLIFGTLFSALPAAADDGGAGSVGGGGLPGASGLGVEQRWYDNPQPGPSYPQGTGTASTNYFINAAGIPTGSVMAGKVTQACNIALAEANSRYTGTGAANSRVVGIMWAFSGDNPYSGYDAAVGPQRFRSALDNWAGASYPGFYNQARVPASYGGTTQTGYAFAAKLARDEIGNGNGVDPSTFLSAVCVAFNSGEPPMSYTLNVTTDAVGFTTPGGTETVYDRVHTTRTGGENATLNATVKLAWDGYGPGSVSSGDPVMARTKSFTVSNNAQNQNSPGFTPADFGWDVWPGGRFWFQVTIPKQGNMAAAVTHGDRATARELWTTVAPPPTKALIDPATGNDLGDDPSVASGTTIDAHIKVQPSGATTFTVKDTLADGRVWLGSATADDPSGIKVLDPSGNPATATVTIESVGDGKVVTAVVTSTTPMSGTYTLVVPTTPWPTATDYTFADTGSFCVTSTCIDTEEKPPNKVTPTPDKAWVLDKDGALVTSDKDWSNSVGADNQVFLPGDAVVAVANDYIHDLDLPLATYQIWDDWSDGIDYLQLTDPGASVYVSVDGSTWVDRTAWFDITSADGKTTAVANSPEFFALTTSDVLVKLILEGSFLPEYNTHGENVAMVNKAGVVWNNDAKNTNIPPIFTWTPDPGKDVIGDFDMGADGTSIDGMNVIPGQTIAYTISVDLRVPEGMAYDIDKFGIEDKYDEKFIPNKSSITVLDARTLKFVAASDYQVNWDDENRSFDLLMNPEWVKANVGTDKPGFLLVRFSGQVDPDAALGSTLENQAWQLINESKTPTPIPTVKIPPITPDKEDLSCDLDAGGTYVDCFDIDGKTVVLGDIIDYRLTMDARPSASQMAYLVHKLGMMDEYDSEYLELQDVTVTVATSGSDNAAAYPVGAKVTDQFNIQDDEGTLYVMAKTVDTRLPGNSTPEEIIPGDPQPSDLAAYWSAQIDPLKDPAINQDLLGNTYHVYLRMKVIKETDGYVIENQAYQNFENNMTQTKVVSNPLKEINPEKDVTVDVDGESINHGLVENGSLFNYKLTSSRLPADRALNSKSWSIVDDYQETHDRLTGSWLVQTQVDLYDGDTLVAAAGDVIDQVSVVDESVESTGLFTFTEDDGTFTISATDTYLDMLNTRKDVEAGWTAYVQMERIAPGVVYNKFVEYYNDTPREPEEVVTTTPGVPEVSLVKYVLSEGVESGTYFEMSDPYKFVGDTEIGFLITNTGTEPLVDLKLTDETTLGGAKVENLTCPEEEMKWLDVEDTILCTGTLTGVKPGEKHTNEAKVTGTGEWSKKDVEDDSIFNALAPAAGGGGGGLAQTGAKVGLVALIATVLIGGGALLALRRKA